MKLRNLFNKCIKFLIIFKIQLFQRELQRSITEKDLTSRLESVESNVKRQFILVVVHHKEDGITNVFDHDFDPKFFEYECYDGEIPENDTCRKWKNFLTKDLFHFINNSSIQLGVCSIGSYSQDQKCLQCPENTYNPSEGASSCLPCPDNGVSRAGSYDFSHCRRTLIIIIKVLIARNLKKKFV